uniref:Serine/threonine protein kinase putative n=1 Tax=Albugo laibachii Nc14 TaxID=890382 RepID=F0WD73_9STRA|nr:serine/threonine protein kinase putative [Albugo laibachii Nc14]|eukprot:CCA19145.1 serine/threonine protein kinase putative [Albugo laibachii Nc14]
MRKYRLISKKGEGTFSEVLKAQNVKDEKYHAIKCMKNHFESLEQVNNLREIQALRRLSPHPHIIKLEEVLYDQPSGRLALVFELMECNLYELIRGRRQFLNPELIQSLMYQLVISLDHMHRKGIFHRDIKPENILIEQAEKLKLADFGSCRGIYSKQPYTEYISTRWYRAPECILTDGYYGPAMDVWGAGCVFFEITSLQALFPGSNELDQLHRIHRILGSPSQNVLQVFQSQKAAHIEFDFAHQEGTSLSSLVPHASADAIDLMAKMLVYDPNKRLSAREVLQHAYFRQLRVPKVSSTKSIESLHLEACVKESVPEAGVSLDDTLPAVHGSLLSLSQQAFESEDSTNQLPPIFSKPNALPQRKSSLKAKENAKRIAVHRHAEAGTKKTAARRGRIC